MYNQPLKPFKMKSKFNLLIAGSALFTTLSMDAQNWGGTTTNAYLNPTSATVSFGSSAAPMAGVKVDVTGGMFRVNGNQILLAGDLNHGIGFYGASAPYFATSGRYANMGIDGPVVYGYKGGALGSNLGGTKNIALRWLETGLVGIGTFSPEDQFQISCATQGSTAANRIVFGSAQGASLMWGTAYMGFNMARPNAGTWTLETDGQHNGGATIFSTVNGGLYFAVLAEAGTGKRTGVTDATVIANTQLAIKATPWSDNGQVGIGTTNPSARLQINSPVTENSLDIVYGGAVNFRVKSTGYVYARDLTIQSGTFPDYVFAKDYKLMPLAEVKSFIQKNSHLPEMPAACEVERDGMSVSQINTLLVKKVEELTLYVIKLQEEMDQLKKEKQ